MRSKYTDMIKAMLRDGLSMKQIDEVVRLKVECSERCEEISEECVVEGYPSHGSTYDLRAASVIDYYQGLINEI